MEIKTIVRNCLDAEVFDAEVNGYIAQGWRLVKRALLGGGGYLYAELEKVDEAPAEEPVEPDPLDAIRFVRDVCKTTPICGPTCPLYEWCEPLPDVCAPGGWNVPPKEG